MTAAFDPYAVLGINRAADAKTIKKAYRKKAAATHPDKEGGSAEAFATVKRAYDILSDAERRSLFDKHGIIEGKPSLDDPVTQRAVQIVASELRNLLDGQGLAYQDVPALLAARIGEGLQQAEAGVDRLRLRLANAKDLRQRFAAKEGKHDYMAQILDYEIAQLEEILPKNEQMLAGIRMALAILADHSFTKAARDWGRRETTEDALARMTLRHHEQMFLQAFTGTSG